MTASSHATLSQRQTPSPLAADKASSKPSLLSVKKDPSSTTLTEPTSKPHEPVPSDNGVAYQYAAVQQMTTHRDFIEYQLIVREQPKHSRMCGVGEKADRRPIDPAPIVQLRVITHDHPVRDQPIANDSTTITPPVERKPGQGLAVPTTSGVRKGVPVTTSHGDGWEDKAWYLENPYYFMYAMLCNAETDEELHLLSDGKTRYSSGSCVSCLYHLKDIDGSHQGFFVFPDLSIRVEGRYRLKLCLFETIGNTVHHCKSIYSAPFNVFTAKRFPGMEESTRLSKSFADQGLKVRVRKHPRSRRRGSKRKEETRSDGSDAENYPAAPPADDRALKRSRGSESSSASGWPASAPHPAESSARPYDSHPERAPYGTLSASQSSWPTSPQRVASSPWDEPVSSSRGYPPRESIMDRSSLHGPYGEEVYAAGVVYSASYDSALADEHLPPRAHPRTVQETAGYPPALRLPMLPPPSRGYDQYGRMPPPTSIRGDEMYPSSYLLHSSARPGAAPIRETMPPFNREEDVRGYGERKWAEPSSRRMSPDPRHAPYPDPRTKPDFRYSQSPAPEFSRGYSRAPPPPVAGPLAVPSNSGTRQSRASSPVRSPVETMMRGPGNRTYLSSHTPPIERPASNSPRYPILSPPPAHLGPSRGYEPTSGHYDAAGRISMVERRVSDPAQFIAHRHDEVASDMDARRRIPAMYAPPPPTDVRDRPTLPPLRDVGPPTMGGSLAPLRPGSPATGLGARMVGDQAHPRFPPSRLVNIGARSVSSSHLSSRRDTNNSSSRPGSARRASPPSTDGRTNLYATMRARMVPGPTDDNRFRETIRYEMDSRYAPPPPPQPPHMYWDERMRDERLRDERAREERMRDNRAREEWIREERIREERIREDRNKDSHPKTN